MTDLLADHSLTRLDRVVIRFTGDSGDGMQLTGDRLTADTAAFGNDLSTLPNFPAQIRAVSGRMIRRRSVKLTVDHDRCSSYGNCALTAPHLFELDPATNLSVVQKDEIGDEDRDVALEAVDGCPAEAISTRE